MIRLVHRGLGGKYTTYVRDSVRAISRKRATELTDTDARTKTYRVAISHKGEPLTVEAIREILRQCDVSFYFGDSLGLPTSITDSCDKVFSVSSLPVPHQVEAMIVVEQIERVIIG